MLWCRVDDNVRQLVNKLAAAKGVTISEYMRNLVLKDLDDRTVFTTILKNSQKETIKVE